MTRNELRSIVSKMVEDANQTKYKEAAYNEAIDIAQKQFAMDSKAYYKDQAITMASGTAAYALPSDFMWEKQVVLNGLELQPISRATLQSIKTDDKWTDDTGTPKYFIIDPELARQSITLYPKPDSTSDGTDLVLTYYPNPETMSSDSSTPFGGSTLMAQFHMAIAAYAAWLLMSYLTQTPEIAQKRAGFIQTYSSKVGEAIQTFGNTKSEPLSFHVSDVRVR